MRSTASALIGALCLLLAMAAQAQRVTGCRVNDAGTQKSWDADCAAAIESEPDPAKQAQLHFQRAYVLNERESYEAALEDLSAACALVPHNSGYLRERGYTFNALGRYPEALVDLDEVARLEPQKPEAFQERALARMGLGDWAGAFADRDRAVELRPAQIRALIARAEARLWLGQFREAGQDLATAKKRLAGAPNADESDYLERASTRLTAWTTHSRGRDPAAQCARAKANEDFAQLTLIGDCTLAFLAAKSPKEKGDALTTRAVSWLVSRQSQDDATGDSQAAAAVDPENPDRHTNLGFSYLQVRHSWAARQEFDRSLKIRPTYLALAGRASANANLGDKSAAFADAKASFEMEPNEAALWVLGDLSKDRGDDASARLYWMGVYHLGSRDDRLMERLRSVGVTDPAAEPADKALHSN